MTIRATAWTLAILLAGCGSPEPEPSPSPTVAPDASAKEAPLPDTAEARGPLKAAVQVVDLDGAPLAGIAPILTTRPNAFDRPVVTGPPSGADGESSIAVPEQKRLFLRAWDPDLNYFPNNYYEILPNQAESIDAMTVTMVPAGAFSAVLIQPNGAPVVAEPVELMMIHPTEGPWWPAQTVTDAVGHATFKNIPAGEFALHLQAASGGATDLPITPLPPATPIDLGEIKLE